MFSAIQSYFDSFGFLRKHGLTWFLWFPLLITLLVFWIGFELTSTVTDSLFEALMAWINPESWLPEWGGFIVDIIYGLLWIILRILLYFAFAFIGGSVILLLMAPVLTWLSEKVAERMGKEVPPFSVGRFFSDLMRAVGLAIRNGAIQIGLTIVCFIIGFIPLIGAASPILLFAINAYFYGYNFFDYTLERRAMSVAESQRFIWNNKFKAIGTGSPFALWMLIPFIGPMTAGFVAIFATVAGTIVLEKEN